MFIERKLVPWEWCWEQLENNGGAGGRREGGRERGGGSEGGKEGEAVREGERGRQ